MSSCRRHLHTNTPKGSLELPDQKYHASVLSVRLGSAYVVDHECPKNIVLWRIGIDRAGEF